MPLKKIILGILSFGPLVYLALFIVVIFPSLTAIVRGEEGFIDEAMFDSLWPAVVAIHFAVMFVLLAMVLYFLVDVYRSPSLTGAEKVIWSFVLVMFNILTVPTYFVYSLMQSPVRSRE